SSAGNGMNAYGTTDTDAAVSADAPCGGAGTDGVRFMRTVRSGGTVPVDKCLDPGAVPRGDTCCPSMPCTIAEQNTNTQRTVVRTRIHAGFRPGRHTAGNSLGTLSECEAPPCGKSGNTSRSPSPKRARRLRRSVRTLPAG